MESTAADEGSGTEELAAKGTMSTKEFWKRRKAEESGEAEESGAKPRSSKALFSSQLSSAPPLSSAHEIPLP
jgi:hypothetical protein